MKKSKSTKTFSKLDFIDEEGRQDIFYWSEKRQKKYHGIRKSLHVVQLYAFNMHLLRSFVENFNFMVILQMTLAAFITYLCKDFNISYDVHVSLFISPIVFPLAFSINTDFQRKEKVLEDLANFKSSAMMWFFCMRDWREACSMDLEYIKAVRNKIKGIIFHLREYLLTEKLDRRKFIVRVIYEDLSDANQLNEKVRCSSMPANSPLVARIIHFVNMMCLSFERLRVIREYRSPRSIRSFTKVLIFLLPLLLAPYYVYLGSKIHLKSNTETIQSNTWSPYYLSVMVAFVFGALQGVQDKLDDPFDGMSEDDINLDTLDEWTLQSLEATCHRSYKIGRFQVVSSAVDGKNCMQQSQIGRMDALSIFERGVCSREDLTDDLELGFHPYAGVLNNIQGNMTILRGGRIKKPEKSFDDLGMLMSQASYPENLDLQENFINTTLPYAENSPEAIHVIPSLSRLPSIDIIDTTLSSLPSTALDFTGSEAPTYGVASYLASVRKNNIPLQSQLDSRSNRSSCISSNLSKRSSRSSVCSTSEIVNNNEQTEFFIGDEVIKRLSPRFQNVPNGRFGKSNGNCASINPLLKIHQDCDEDANEDEELYYESSTNPLYANRQNRTFPIFDELHQRNSSVFDTLQQRTYPVFDNYQRSNSPLLDNIQRSNSLSANNLHDNNIQQTYFPLVNNSHQSSPLLKVSNNYLSSNSASPRSRFTVSKSNPSLNNDINISENTILTDYIPDEHILKSPKYQSSPKSYFLNPNNDSCANINPVILNMHQNSDEDTDGDEDLPIELSSTPLFDNSHQRNSQVSPNTQHSNSPTCDDLHKTNSLVYDNIDMRKSPLFENRDLSNIPLFDNLSPKSKQRFIINGVGRENHAIISNDNAIQDLKNDIFY